LNCASEGAHVLKDGFMEGIPALYLGRLVSKDNFRTFIYAPSGAKKLVESWEEYERHMGTGLWFASREGSKINGLKEHEVKEPKKRQKKVKSTDDFLPKD
jgi:hypothetical protein